MRNYLIQWHNRYAIPSKWTDVYASYLGSLLEIRPTVGFEELFDELIDCTENIRPDSTYYKILDDTVEYMAKMTADEANYFHDEEDD